MAAEKDVEAMSDEEWERQVEKLAKEIVDSLVEKEQRRRQHFLDELDKIIEETKLKPLEEMTDEEIARELARRRPKTYGQAYREVFGGDPQAEDS